MAIATKLSTLVLATTLLAGCQSAERACPGVTAVDYTPSRSQHAAMSPAERRAAQARLDAMARRCGWEP